MTESQYQMMVRLAERNRALIGLNPDEIKPAADPIIAEIRSQIQKYDRSGNRDAWILKAAQYAATQPDFWKTVNGVDIPRLNVHQAVVAWIDSGFDPERRPSAARARDLVKQVIYHSKKGRLPGKGGLRPYCRRVERAVVRLWRTRDCRTRPKQPELVGGNSSSDITRSGALWPDAVGADGAWLKSGG